MDGIAPLLLEALLWPAALLVIVSPALAGLLGWRAAAAAALSTRTAPPPAGGSSPAPTPAARPGAGRGLLV